MVLISGPLFFSYQSVGGAQTQKTELKIKDFAFVPFLDLCQIKWTGKLGVFLRALIVEGLWELSKNTFWTYIFHEKLRFKTYFLTALRDPLLWALSEIPPPLRGGSVHLSCSNELQKTGKNIAFCEFLHVTWVTCFGSFSAPLEVMISSLGSFWSARGALRAHSKV